MRKKEREIRKLVRRCVDEVFSDDEYYEIENLKALNKVIADGMLMWDSNYCCLVEELGFPYPSMLNERKTLDYELKCISIILDGVVFSLYEDLVRRKHNPDYYSKEELELSEAEFADERLNSICERYEPPFYTLMSCHDNWSDWTWQGDFVYDYLKKGYKEDLVRGSAKWEKLAEEGLTHSYNRDEP